MTFRSYALPMLAALILPGTGQAATPVPKSIPSVAANPAPAVAVPAPNMRRFMVVRTFPAGALAGLDAAGKQAVNKTNAMYGVNWVHSYASADKTKTFCIYEGPSEKAILYAASANKIPVDSIVEIPVVLQPR